jgi:hypothetical protein
MSFCGKFVGRVLLFWILTFGASKFDYFATELEGFFST